MGHPALFWLAALALPKPAPSRVALRYRGRRIWLQVEACPGWGLKGCARYYFARVIGPSWSRARSERFMAYWDRVNELIDLRGYGRTRKDAVEAWRVALRLGRKMAGHGLYWAELQAWRRLTTQTSEYDL